MIDRTVVSCQTCHATFVLPDDPAALATAMTDFTDRHRRLQHWKLELIPSFDSELSSAELSQPV
jgi:hypothetical protein